MTWKNFVQTLLTISILSTICFSGTCIVTVLTVQTVHIFTKFGLQAGLLQRFSLTHTHLGGWWNLGHAYPWGHTDAESMNWPLHLGHIMAGKDNFHGINFHICNSDKQRWILRSEINKQLKKGFKEIKSHLQTYKHHDWPAPVGTSQVQNSNLQNQIAPLKEML